MYVRLFRTKYMTG